MRFARGSPWRPAASAASSQRRGVWAAADVGVADGRRLAVRAGERDLPGAERLVGARDLRLRLLAGKPAEVRAADADAGQDPAVVLLTPRVQDAGADAGGEQEAQDERDAEAEGERPSAPRRCRRLAVGHGRRERQDRHGIDDRLGAVRPWLGRGIRPWLGDVRPCPGRRIGPRRERGIVRCAPSDAWAVSSAAGDGSASSGPASRRTSAASSGSPAGVSMAAVGASAGWSAAESGRSVIRGSGAIATIGADDLVGVERGGHGTRVFLKSLGRSEREPVRDDPQGPCVTFPVSQVAQPPRRRTTIRRFGSSPIDCVATCG